PALEGAGQLTGFDCRRGCVVLHRLALRPGAPCPRRTRRTELIGGHPGSHSTSPPQTPRLSAIGGGPPLTCSAITQAERAYRQHNQAEGVPPLELTGERTLPDVPDENYWYRRHVAVYEWIAERCVGLRVADLACGEGYGSELLARRAAEVIGVDANPE